MGRPVVVDWGEDGATLGALYRSEHDRLMHPRFQALWLLRQERSVWETAAIVGVHERTVQPWLAWYRRPGMAGIRAHLGRVRGKPPS